MIHSKKVVLVILILSTVFSWSFQSSTYAPNIVHPQESFQPVFSDCEQIFYKYYRGYTLKKDKLFQPIFERLSDSSYLDVRQFLECGANLASKGDSIAEKYVMNFVEELYTELMSGNDNFRYKEVYAILWVTLAKIPTKDAFELGLKFMAKNVSNYDELKNIPNFVIGDTPDFNFGIEAFEYVLLPMMSDESRKYYSNLKFEMYWEHTGKASKEDPSDKAFHEFFYPLIKADWEAGKIKLKEK